MRGGNPYRAKAYSRAADSLAALIDPLDVLIAKDRLMEIPGVGEAIVLIDRFQAGLKQQVLLSAETGPPFKCRVLGGGSGPPGAVAAGDTARVELWSSPFRALPALEHFKRGVGPIAEPKRVR